MSDKDYSPLQLRVEAKIDKVVEKLTSIDVTLAAQHESLKDHMRRTELLEKAIEPLQRQSAMATGALKFMSVLALTLGIIASIISFFTHK